VVKFDLKCLDYLKKRWHGLRVLCRPVL
jgi:hypothetical protein